MSSPRWLSSGMLPVEALPGSSAPPPKLRPKACLVRVRLRLRLRVRARVRARVGVGVRVRVRVRVRVGS